MPMGALAGYLKPDLLYLDDFGMKSFPPKGNAVLLEACLRVACHRVTYHLPLFRS
jgi:hypothetical protein